MEFVKILFGILFTIMIVILMAVPVTILAIGLVITRIVIYTSEVEKPNNNTSIGIGIKKY